MIVYGALWGPYETPDGKKLVTVFNTNEGDTELYFDTFDEYYSFLVSLPQQAPVEYLDV